MFEFVLGNTAKLGNKYRGRFFFTEEKCKINEIK